MESSSPSGYALRRTLEDGTETQIEISGVELVVGRDPASGHVIDDPGTSRRHARIELQADRLIVHDLQSRNGTFVNSERVGSAELHDGDTLRMGNTVFQVVRLPTEAATRELSQAVDMAISSQGATVVSSVADSGLTQRLPESPAVTTRERGVVPDEMLTQPVISEAEVAANGVDVQVVPCLTVGGGMGSFQWADLLRVSGISQDDIRVISNESTPYGRYQRLCRNSQIPPHERLRSNSDSRPDNPWGFPGYASAEAVRELAHGQLRRAGRITWSIFGEPAFAETYTPRSGVVFSALDREMRRIGWDGMRQSGRVRAIRKTAEGRLAAIVSSSDEEQRRHYMVAAQFVHMSFGYPAIQLLPDLAAFREHYGDRQRVVNAYEEHEAIYQELRKRGGLVVLRGRGIVASRILQRLWEERHTNKEINVVHLHRSRLTEGHRYGRSTREVESEWEFQPFNWPKGCWTGEQRETLEQASDTERKVLLEVWGGTTTADRRDWRRIVREGLRAGWYRPEYGTVRDVKLTDDGRVATTIAHSLTGGGTLELVADFVIDCTGLVASPERAPVMGDLISTYQLDRNPLGRLAVSNDFEITGMRHGDARMYAAGATTLGGPHAAVDSFLGVQYAAYRAVHAMVGEWRGLRRLSGLYSMRQWLRWVRGVAP